MKPSERERRQAADRSEESSRAPGWLAGAVLVVLFAGGLALGASLDDGVTLPWTRSESTRPTAVERASGEPSRAAGPGGTAGGAGAASVPRGRPFTERLGQATGSPAAERLTPVVAAARRVIPSVVSVNVLRREEVRRGLFDFWVPRGYERTVRGLGSGFVIDDRGYLLTNQHVIRGAVEVVVADRNGNSWNADVVGADELTDIAVLRIPTDEVPPAPLGTSSDLMVGEPAIAVGNPYGYLLSNPEPTVTAGVISGVGRDIRPAGSGEALYADMVQTDASINPGNSGGPLVNVRGRVIGVNSSIFSPSRESGSVGLGFAIPIDRAVTIAEELRVHGRIRRPWVGLNLREEEGGQLPGLVVERVARASPADEAGLRDGDRILRADDDPIRSLVDWEVRLLERGVGSTVTIRYRRGGSEATARLPVRELPSERADRVEVLRGLQMVTVTPQIAQERELPFEGGALIVEVSDRVRSATDLQQGDVIVAVNRQRIRTAQEAAEIFDYLSGRGAVLVQLVRDGSLRTRTFYIR